MLREVENAHCSYFYVNFTDSLWYFNIAITYKYLYAMCSIHTSVSFFNTYLQNRALFVFMFVSFAAVSFLWYEHLEHIFGEQ